MACITEHSIAVSGIRSTGICKHHEEMVAIAESLGKSFDHLRVDMYEADNNIWLGELTPYSWSGLTPFVSDEADRLVGSYWSLQRPTQRALRAILFQWRHIPSTTIPTRPPA
jgi:hypothetical protein